ncbi:hypothetical protein ACOMHN_046095 [Nucella lapillus]
MWLPTVYRLLGPSGQRGQEPGGSGTWGREAGPVCSSGIPSSQAMGRDKVWRGHRSRAGEIVVASAIVWLCRQTERSRK